MNTELRPATVHALRSFQQRRRRLLLARAALIVLLVALVAALAIALIDRLRWIPDSVRPWLTLTAYLTALIVAWKKAGSLIRLARTDLSAATLLETAAPHLHERLVPAVELAQSGHLADHQDSPEFRATLQDQIALEVQQIDWKKALPLSSLSPVLKGLAAVLALIIGLSFVPRLHLPGFLARAALPFAPIERPSSVTIQVIRPVTPTALAPFVSEIPLTAEVTGHLGGSRVEVEIQEDGTPSRRMEMTSTSTDRYESTLAVGQSSLRYRVSAADGLTRWFTLDARARPATTDFVKVITPPDYVPADPQTLTDSHGDLEVLEGSTVRLELTSSEPLKAATLQLNPEDPTPPAPLETEALAPNRIAVTFPITESLHSWQAQLTSAETGFTNDEASPWRITPVPDTPPSVALTEPGDALQVLPDEALRVLGFASDDVGLKAVALAHSLNAGDWQTAPVTVAAERELDVQLLLNLAPLGLKGGDSLLLKWIATDLKGQTADSNVVRVLIQEQTVDPRLRAWAATQKNMQRTAAAVNELTHDLRDASQKIKPKETGTEPQSQLAKARAALAEAEKRAEELWTQVQEAALTAPNALAQEETRILGERLAKLRQVQLPRIEEALTDPVQTEALRKDASEAASLADTVEKAAAAFAAEAAAQVASQSSEHLRRQETLLTENALEANRSEDQRASWQEQQRAAATTAAAVDRDLQQLEEASTDRNIEKRMEDIREQLTEAATDLAESLDRPEQNNSPEHLYGAADQLRNRLQRAAEESRNAATQLAQKAAQLREQLNRQDNPALAALDMAKSALQEAAALAENPKRKPSNQKDGLTPEQRAEQNLADAAKQLQDQAELRSQALNADAEAALDLNRLSRAADQLARAVPDSAPRQPNQPADSEQAAALKDLATQSEQLQQAARTLATSAELKEAANLLSQADSPTTPPQDADALTNTAAQAQAAAEGLKKAIEPLKRNNETQPIAKLAEQAANQAKAAAETLTNQATQALRDPGFTPPPVAQTTPAADAAAQAMEQFSPQTAAARETLEGLTPAIFEMMQQLAQDLESAQEKAEAAAAQAATAQPVDQVAAEAQALTPEAQANDTRMESLQAALKQEANQADLAQADQRQLARTADTALEQMRQEAPQITDNLQQAAQATESQPQQQALENAAQAEQKTAQALQQLAESFAQMESGESLTEQQLAGLQQMEQELGVQQALDEAYERAEALAELEEMAQNDPAAALAALEQELQQNPQMQKALAEIGKTTAQAAEQQLATQVNQPSFLASATAEAAHELARVARHEQRLQQESAAEAIAQASQQLQQTADAAQTDPASATPQTSQQAATAAQQASQAAEAAAAQTPPVPSANLLAQVQSAALAQALDQLDQTLNPQGSGQQGEQQQPGQEGGDQQQGQQQGQQQSQQQAGQNLAEASESQQQSMSDARNQGQVPGSQSPPSDMAQNSDKPSSENSQQATDGSSMNPQGEMGVLAGQVIFVDGDWGSLPAHTADDLTEATRQDAPPEYRAAIENYYKAIATKARE